MTLRALIFDVDGTLADNERYGHRPAFNEAFAMVGLPWVWDEALYGTLLPIAGGKERIRHYAEHYDPDTFAQPDFESLVQTIHREKTRLYLARLASGTIPLRHDVGPLICEARSEGVRLAIASSTTRENVFGLLRANLGPDAEHWFDVVAAGDTVPVKKPAPDIYLWTLQALDLPATDCLAIEDSAHGLAASLGAGIPTVVTMNDYTRNDCFDGARMTLSEFNDVDLGRLREWHASATLP